MRASSDWILRPGRGEDAFAMAELDSACFPPHMAFPVRLFAQLLARASTVAVVAEDANGGLAGFLIAECFGDDANILTIDVYEKHRKKGLGTAILAQACSQCAQKGVEKIFLQVYTRNSSALAFYRRNGFVKLQRMQNYYGKGQDAWLMVRPLP